MHALAVAEAGGKLDEAARAVLARAAGEIFHRFRLVPIRPATNLAERFLSVERLEDRLVPSTFLVTNTGDNSGVVGYLAGAFGDFTDVH